MSVSVLPILLVFTIATFPGEWLEENLPALWIIPTNLLPWKVQTAIPSVYTAQFQQKRWTSLHELLVAGKADHVTGKPTSLWSNVLVLPNFGVGDRVKFDAEGKVAISSDAVSLHARALEGAVFVGAHLRRADFTGAQLTSANLSRADVQEAKLGCDRAGEEGRQCGQLQGARLEFAQLQGSSLFGAQLQGASLFGAQLQGASLFGAQLQGASLNYAQLQGASLDYAQLQGASLNSAQLKGASLNSAQLQGASLNSTQLQGASLQGVFVWRAEPPSAGNLEGAII